LFSDTRYDIYEGDRPFTSFYQLRTIKIYICTPCGTETQDPSICVVKDSTLLRPSGWIRDYSQIINAVLFKKGDK